MSYEHELAAALGWFDETDRIALDRFAVGVPAETKPDGTPVTQADRLVEEALRESIERTFSGDVVLGEEQGATGTGGRRWIVDPIDGTRNYRRGIPIYATLVALEDDGRLVLGAVSAPGLRTRWWATLGGGAFRDGDRIHVSAEADLGESEVASGSVGSMAAAGLLDGFLALASRAARQRGFGDFWGHMLVAQGSIEVMVEPEVSLWDLAAPKVIVEEAGGRLTSLSGEDRADGGNCLTTNGLVHAEALGLLVGG